MKIEDWRMRRRREVHLGNQNKIYISYSSRIHHRKNKISYHQDQCANKKIMIGRSHQPESMRDYRQRRRRWLDGLSRRLWIKSNQIHFNIPIVLIQFNSKKTRIIFSLRESRVLFTIIIHHIKSSMLQYR